MEDRFNFFVPIGSDELEKSKNLKGEERYKNMLIQGVASDPSEDTDGEKLMPIGYDLSRFKRYGFINYDHRAKDNPKYFIGEPIDAKVKDNKFFVKGKLYSKSQMARDVWDTMILLKESGSNRQMGFSIEGKALERDINNPKIIKRALITGLAMTLNPKNSNSYAEIVKGEYNDPYVDYEYNLPELLKSESDGGQVVYLVDITNEETGVRYTIDKDLNLKVQKAISTITAKPLVKESLDKKLKKLPFGSGDINNIAKAKLEGKINEEFYKDIKFKITEIFQKI